MHDIDHLVSFNAEILFKPSIPSQIIFLIFLLAFFKGKIEEQEKYGIAFFKLGDVFEQSSEDKHPKWKFKPE